MPLKELSPLPKLSSSRDETSVIGLNEFEIHFSKLLRQITLYSGSLGLGVDEERSQLRVGM